MKHPIITKLFTTLCCGILLLSIFTEPLFANSAQARWDGVTSTGMIITEENCPIEVEKEVLTLDIQEFPQNHYQTNEEFLHYTGKVTAEYTFYNPANYTVTATLVFPFGSLPDYANVWDHDTGEYINASDTEKYNITVNGKQVETRIRHTLSSMNYFALEDDLPKLVDGYMKDSFFTEDLKVTIYHYDISGIPDKYHTAATIGFVWNGNNDKTRILLKDQSGYEALDDGLLINTWAKNGNTETIYFFGEVPETGIEWKVYENGACKKEIAGTVTCNEAKSQTMTFKEFALQNYNAASGISESDWYNAMIFQLNEGKYDWSYGAIQLYNTSFDFTNSLMRWYEYDITIEPHSKIVNTVTAPIYPAIKLDYEPAIFDYTYLLSPAKSWADFGNLEIQINTPYYILENEVEGFTKTETGYTLSRDGLPNEELKFTLCSAEKTTRPLYKGSIYYTRLINALIIILLICIAVTAFVIIRRRKRRTDPQHKWFN